MAVGDDGELRTLDMQLYVTANACPELTSECVRVPVFFFIYNIYWCSSCWKKADVEAQKSGNNYVPTIPYALIHVTLIIVM